MADLIPDHQPEKLAIISDIALLMPPEFGDLKPEKLSYAEEMTSLNKFEKNLKESLLRTSKDSEYAASLNRLFLGVEQFRKAVDRPDKGKRMFDMLEKNLLLELPSLLR